MLQSSDLEDQGVVLNITNDAPKGYRVSRKKFFFTFSNVDQQSLKKHGEIKKYKCEDFLQHSESFGELVKYLIANEKHQDGSDHFHMYLEYSKKIDKKDSRWFDYDGLHPNDKGNPTSWFAVARYCSKDGNFITNFWEMDPYKQAMEAPTYKEGIDIIKDKRPRDYMLFSEKIESTLEKMHKKPKRQSLTPSRYIRSTFNEPPELTKWVEENCKPDMERRKCLILIGSTQMGKTSWAKSVLPSFMQFRGDFDVKKWEQEADLIIFDDIKWTSIPYKKQLLTGMKEEASITDKYQKKYAIVTDKPCIVCLNPDDITREDEKEMTGDYWSANSVIYILREKLF